MSVIVERQNLAITVGYGYDETTCLLKLKMEMENITYQEILFFLMFV